VLATGSPAEIDATRRKVDEALCRFATALGTAAYPLPEPYNSGPFAKLINAPGKRVCN
jgi:hypothetical protein